jgi:hypothetical protein
MSTRNPNDPVNETGSTSGYEASDVNVQGILVFLVALAICLGVFFVFCFGMGKVINNALEKRDGPPNKWNELQQTPNGKLENMKSNPAQEQQQLQQMTQRFPTPRLQPDDGNQEVADMHAREDLLMEHYTWVDRSEGKVRIPIERAMELIAQRGLSVAPQTEKGQMMAGESAPVVVTPLTNGYARTGYEQEQQNASKAPGEQSSAKAANE